MGKKLGGTTWISALALCAACGGSTPTEQPVSAESTGGEERAAEPDQLAVTGLRGTLSQHEIQGALEPRMLKFSRCVQKRSGEVEWVAGAMQFQFKVALDGSVAQVFPSQSSMGDRETERCMVEVAKSTRFPAPHGGEAEFSWSLEVPLDPDVREPVVWSAADVQEVLSTRTAEVETQCGGGPYAVTAYLDTEGKVVAAGAATGDEASAPQLDCVVLAVQGWLFPSPGSYAAKLTFTVE
jgi:hypothetical protein